MIGDLSLIVENKNFEVFMTTLDFKCLNEKITFFLLVNLRCIDLALTNKKKLFEKINNFEVGILDDHGFVHAAF